MPDWLAFLVTLSAGAAAVFGYLVLQRVSAKDGVKALNRDDTAVAVREEAERTRRVNEEQFCALRQALGESQRGTPDAAHGVLRDMSQSLGEQSRRSSEQMGDAMRAFETRLDGAFGRQVADLGALRQELGAEGRRITEALLRATAELRAAQVSGTEVLARRLAELRAQG